MRNRIGTSVIVGIVMATLYSLWVTVVYYLGGPSALAEHNLTLPMAVATYYFAGAIGGLIVGVMLPLARHPLGAILVGIVVGFVAFFSMGVATKGMPPEWSSRDWKGVLVLGLLWGGFGGFIYRRIWINT